ncbi:MAG: hypothetical protein NVSMB30_03820 [Hymenobacter sp.]
MVGCQSSTRPASNPAGAGREWPEYLGGGERNHYSTLAQITPENVGKLRVAWEYHSRDSGQVQCNAIVVAGTLYGVTASNEVFALDAATGKQRWRYANGVASESNTNRGVTYWSNGQAGAKAESRILYAFGSYLCALNARTGQPIASFGEQGHVSLKAGLGPTAKNKFVISNTPGTLFKDVIIMPLRVSEGADAAPGFIQAFDVKTGKLAWVFHTIPQPGEYGYGTWPKTVYQNTEVGGANCWAGMAVDRKRGIVFVPTGSAAFDFYGGNRKGTNLFADCLLALDARTGKRLWHYQFVHHDIWDKDLPAPPNLVTVRQQGKTIEAVAQVTKTGYVYVFDRVTGVPLFPIKEMPVPASELAGEAAWPTQPVPTLPRPFARQSLTAADISPIAENRGSLLAQFQRARQGLFQPLGLTPTLVLPGADGGAEWGGAAVDPDGIMYVNVNNVAWQFSLSATQTSKTTATTAQLRPGQHLYVTHCTPCHGPERKGNPTSGYPSLVNIEKRRDVTYVSHIISNGKGRMPGFAGMTDAQKQALLAFLFGKEKSLAAVHDQPAATDKEPTSTEGPILPYRFNGYDKFLDSKGYPGIKPPWGTLTAINLNTGQHVWQQTLGEFKDLTARGIPATGTENYGGPVVTAGGVLFIAATKDGMFRAYNKKTGELLWQTALPAAGFATPSTYEVNGKQYVVVACGGTKLNTKKGDSYVAFALP